MPHALVLDVHYDYTDNVLVAGTLGRGAWTLPDPFGNAGAASSPTGAGMSLGTSPTSVATIPGGVVFTAGQVFLTLPAAVPSTMGRAAEWGTTPTTEALPTMPAADSDDLTTLSVRARSAKSLNQALASLFAHAEGAGSAMVGWKDWLHGR